MWSLPRFFTNIRTLHTCSGPLRSKKDYEDLRKLNRRSQERSLRRKDRANPFKTNVGIANTLKYMELSPKDSGFESNQLFEGSEEAELERIGDEVSSQRQKSVDRQYKQLLSREEVKHIMELKNLFPRGKDPNLLSWIEKETIKHLNKVDPNTWTVLALAESFPSADARVIKKILKSTAFVPSERIEQHDKDVALNWKLLQKNHLPIREDLKEHILQNNGGSLKQPNCGLLPQEVTDKVIQNYNERTLPLPRKRKKGPFGSIISEYKEKVGLSSKEEDSEERVHTVENIFKKDQILFDEWNIDEPSPYRDTAILNTSVNLRKEPHMTAKEFKEVYFKSKANKEDIALALKSETNPLKREYFQWLHEEFYNPSQEESNVEKIDVEEVLKEIK